MSTINSIRKKNSNNRQQAGVWAKTTIKCRRVATTNITTNTHTKAPANRTHTLCSRDIKLKSRECAHEKYLLDNVLTMILNRIIHQPLLNTSEAFSSPWTADNYKSLYLTLQGICLSHMQHTNGWHYQCVANAWCDSYDPNARRIQ